MNIAIINNLYEPFERGGAEKIAKIEYEAFSSKGHSVITVSLRPFFSRKPSKPNHYYLPSLFPSLHRIPKPLRLLWHFLDSFDFVNAFKIRRILEANKIDAVLTHNMCGIGKPAFLLCKKLKHIHTLHDIALLHPSGLMFYREEGNIDSGMAAIYRSVNKLFLRQIRIVVSPSRWLLGLHESKGFFLETGKKLAIPNPSALPKADADAIVTGRTSGFVFLYVGLISKHKGMDLLLDAWQEAAKAGNAELKLIGQCDDKELLQKIKKTDNVRYLGKKNASEVAAAMKAANCLIVPSVCYENSPSVIYEAHSSGLPFIASRLGGIPELAESFGGLTFIPTKQELRAMLEKIIEDPKCVARNRELPSDSVLTVDDYAGKIEGLLE